MSARPVALRTLLAGAPRSLSALSIEHRDGWGLAWTDETRADAGEGPWALRKGTSCAAASDDFRRLAEETRTTLAIAHVRQKTVGPTSLANTHPFRRGCWVLAHNGTIENLPGVTARCSPHRLREISGDTDSERLFALLMTAIDESFDVEQGLVAAVRALRQVPQLGAVNFLLSDGERLYAHRQGRTLFLLDRTEAPGRRAASIAIASERLTDERWTEIPQGTLLMVSGGQSPAARMLVSSSTERGDLAS